jgi:hypothetical protein
VRIRVGCAIHHVPLPFALDLPGGRRCESRAGVAGRR